MVYTSLGYYCIEKEGHFDACYNMDEPSGHYAKRKQPVTKGWILYDSTYMWYLE